MPDVDLISETKARRDFRDMSPARPRSWFSILWLLRFWTSE